MHQDELQISPRSSLTLHPDGSALLEHTVAPDDSFERAAGDVLNLARVAQARHPGAQRHLRVHIDGHTGERAGFDADFFEFQQEFLLVAIGKFFTTIQTPLTGSLGNPEPQMDNLPDRLQIEDNQG